MTNRFAAAIARGAIAVLLTIFSHATWGQDGPARDAEPVAVADVPYRPPPPGPRSYVFISDLHFGVGRRSSDGKWDPTEDFRWPHALKGFLDRISADSHDQTDLVVVGDFLELWQPPKDIPCAGANADLGCTRDEMQKLAQLVSKAHDAELGLLRAFAERGENRIHMIPGNHDATIRYERVWTSLGSALNAGSGRIQLVSGGIWTSPSGRILAEHGHQIGVDVNRYETWPRIVRQQGDVSYIVRPWGELFVQKLFNEQEATYPIIDNLSPETAGARYRAADRGIAGSAQDIARMLFFNLWETSPTQQAAMLGPGPAGKQEWDIRVARAMGADLFLYALPPDDPMRKMMSTPGTDADQIKAELTALANDPARVPDETIQHLCDLSAANSQKLCRPPELGSLLQNAFVARDKVLARHLRERLQQRKSVRVFIFGHTHQYELPRKVELNDLVSVTVANTGAFQRLIDDEGFKRRLNGRAPEVGLRTMQPEDLPPCYTAILMSSESAEPEVKAWRMDETGTGTFVSPADQGCR